MRVVAARMQRMVPFWFVSMMRSRSSSVKRSTGLRPLSRMPALFTRMSILPNASTAAAMRCSGSSGLEMSHGTASVRPPVWLISLATSSSASLRRAAMTTLAPSAANRRAMAAPTPEFAPVTTATLPSSLLMMCPLPYAGHVPAPWPRPCENHSMGSSVEDGRDATAGPSANGPT